MFQGLRSEACQPRQEEKARPAADPEAQGWGWAVRSHSLRRAAWPPPPFLGSPAFNLPPFVTPLLSPPVLGGGEGSGQEKQISGGGRLGRGCGGGRPLGAGLGGPISRRMCEIGEVRAAQAWRWCPIKLEYVPAPCKQAWRRQLRERRGPFGGGGRRVQPGLPKVGNGRGRGGRILGPGRPLVEREAFLLPSPRVFSFSPRPLPSRWQSPDPGICTERGQRDRVIHPQTACPLCLKSRQQPCSSRSCFKRCHLIRQLKSSARAAP